MYSNVKFGDMTFLIDEKWAAAIKEKVDSAVTLAKMLNYNVEYVDFKNINQFIIFIRNEQQDLRITFYVNFEYNIIYFYKVSYGVAFKQNFYNHSHIRQTSSCYLNGRKFIRCIHELSRKL